MDRQIVSLQRGVGSHRRGQPDRTTRPSGAEKNGSPLEGKPQYSCTATVFPTAAQSRGAIHRATGLSLWIPLLLLLP